MRKREIAAIYLSGLVQGLALVAFPAASSILTSPHEFNFSNVGYGSLFVPQAVMSILASILSTKLTLGGRIKPVLLAGLFANFLSMALFAVSYIFMKEQLTAYGVLLAATASLGLGFGLTVPCLNTFAGIFFPLVIDSAVLILNALLGLGTAMAPVLVALFAGMGFWWGLPLLLAMGLGLLFLMCLVLPLQEGRETLEMKAGRTKAGIPLQFWVFALFALLYGFVETINGNWATVFMSKSLGTGTNAASLALTCFWSMVTIGRISFAALERYISQRTTYRLLPFVIAAAFLFISFLSPGGARLGVFAFGLAGLGCSALLPLTISFASKELASIKNSVAGGVIAFYLLGYGIAAFGAGQLVDSAGIRLGTVFGWSAAIALLMGFISFRVAGKFKFRES